MKLEKELSKNEDYVIKWFEENGIEVISAKQYVSKTKFKIRKDGIEDDFELLSEVTNIKKYMEMYKQSLDMKLEIEKLSQDYDELKSRFSRIDEPKKVLYIDRQRTMYKKKWGKNARYDGVCPCCSGHIYPRYNYCPNCGQKIYFD